MTRLDINEIREACRSFNNNAKKQMIYELIELVKARDNCIIGEFSEYGLFFNTKIAQQDITLAINPNMDITRPGRTGKATADDLKFLFWIPIIAKINGEVKYSYRLDFTSLDFDENTCNFHTNAFGGLQIWRDLISNKTGEVGGSIMPKPKKDKEGVYNLDYPIEKAFPCNVRQERYNMPQKPWGFDIENIPILDMSDKEFNMKKAAEFFLNLILLDLSEKIATYCR